MYEYIYIYIYIYMHPRAVRRIGPKGSSHIYTMNTYGGSESPRMRRPRAHQGTRPGPPKNHPGPTGPCQEPPKSH